MQLSSVDAAKKRSAAYAHLRNCNLCPRLCGVNRYETTGMCLIGDKAKVNVIAPHGRRAMPATAERSESSKKQPATALLKPLVARFRAAASLVSAKVWPPQPVLNDNVGAYCP